MGRVVLWAGSGVGLGFGRVVLSRGLRSVCLWRRCMVALNVLTSVVSEMPVVTMKSLTSVVSGLWDHIIISD